MHLNGWARDGLQVLDRVHAEGGDADRTILSHMNPSHDDFGYQAAVAERGVYVEYEVLGMDYFYPPDRQCPSDTECVGGIARMVAAGYAERLLLSQDVFLKIMLTRYGGFGYAHILRNVVPALRRIGVSGTLPPDSQSHHGPRRATSTSSLVPSGRLVASLTRQGLDET